MCSKCLFFLPPLTVTNCASAFNGINNFGCPCEMCWSTTNLGQRRAWAGCRSSCSCSLWRLRLLQEWQLLLLLLQLRLGRERRRAAHRPRRVERGQLQQIFFSKKIAPLSKFALEFEKFGIIGANLNLNTSCCLSSCSNSAFVCEKRERASSPMSSDAMAIPAGIWIWIIIILVFLKFRHRKWRNWGMIWWIHPSHQFVQFTW